MRPQRDLPPAAAAALRPRLEPGEAIHLSLPTDLGESGRYVEEWLVVTQRHVCVLRPAPAENGHAPRLVNGDAAAGGWHVLTYPLATCTQVETEALVGGGRLRARFGGEMVTLVYYSATLAPRFAEAAKIIEALAQGKEPERGEEEPERTRCEKCGRLLPEPNGPCPACVQRAAVLIRLARYVKPYWPAAAALALLSLTSTGAQIIPPALTRLLVDRVLVPREHFEWLIWLSLALVGVGLLESLAGMGHGWIVAWLSARVTHDIRAHIYRRLERLTLRFYDKRQIG
ncbi:MAG TPA: ABC transporter transmembrane domain-containing protein, partial [Limnochordia bacterium]